MKVYKITETELRSFTAWLEVFLFSKTNKGDSISPAFDNIEIVDVLKKSYALEKEEEFNIKDKLIELQKEIQTSIDTEIRALRKYEAAMGERVASGVIEIDRSERNPSDNKVIEIVYMGGGWISRWFDRLKEVAKKFEGEDMEIIMRRKL